MEKQPKKKIQWHPAFCASMELELKENWNDLEFIPEHLLSRKPLQMDLLIIRNDKNAVIQNEIGHLFKKYNIMEYKGPGSSMDIDSFYKTNAYACLYKASAASVNGYRAEEITITLVRYEYPRELLKCLQREGYHMEEVMSGIFYISGRTMFRTQLIVGNRLPHKEHIWLTALTKDISRKKYTNFLDRTTVIKQKHERECAEAILEVVSSANKALIENWKEERNMMVPTLMEIFAPELEQWKKEAVESGLQEGRELGIRQGKELGIQQGKELSIQQGREQGSNLKLISLICRKLKKGKTAETIAEELEEEPEIVERICNAAERFAPEYDVEKIYEAL